jgi:threonine 3-dehydrogenase
LKEVDVMTGVSHVTQLDRSSGADVETATVLVTGAGGEVGFGLLKTLHDSGSCRVVGLDLRPLRHRIDCEEVLGDVTDLHALKQLFSDYRFTEIFHLAALLSRQGEEHPRKAHDVNATGTMNLLQCAMASAKDANSTVRFIFPSSIAVYGHREREEKESTGAVGEGEALRPATMYGCTKLYSEALGRYFGGVNQERTDDQPARWIDFRCVRYPGLISGETLPSGGTTDYVPEMLHAAATGTPYVCFVEPRTRLPFMTMPDAIEATRTLAAAPRHLLTRDVYNISSFCPTAGEIADVVTSYFPDARISFEPVESRQRIVDSWPQDVDCSAAHADWGFTPRHDLRSAFEEYLIPAVTARYENGGDR